MGPNRGDLQYGDKAMRSITTTRQKDQVTLADVKATSGDSREQRCRQEKIGLQTL